jgi:hypothetical protein
MIGAANIETNRPPLPDDILRDENGSPLRLFHGTTRDFVGFRETELRSVGFHFGDPDQANHFARTDSPGARILPVYLRSKRPLDVTGSDFGWLKPKATALCLFLFRVISQNELESLLGGTATSMTCPAERLYNSARYRPGYRAPRSCYQPDARSEKSATDCSRGHADAGAYYFIFSVGHIGGGISAIYQHRSLPAITLAPTVSNRSWIDDRQAHHSPVHLARGAARMCNDFNLSSCISFDLVDKSPKRRRQLREKLFFHPRRFERQRRRCLT